MPRLISMMQGIAESAQLAKTLGFTPTSCGAPSEGGSLAAPYVKVKLDAIASEQFTPQMQLAHALKDARLALSPGRAAHHAGAGKHRRTVAAGGGRGICRRGFVCGISVAVAVVKSVVSTHASERSGHSGHLSSADGASIRIYRTLA